MANQMIALQARAPQSAGLGSAIQQNAQMINMLSQQKAAERQAAQAQQELAASQRKEARDVAAADIDLAGKQIDYHYKRATAVNTPQGYQAWLAGVAKDSPEFAEFFATNLPPEAFNRDDLIRMVGSVKDNFDATYAPAATENIIGERGEVGVLSRGGFGAPTLTVPKTYTQGGGVGGPDMGAAPVGDGDMAGIASVLSNVTNDTEYQTVLDAIGTQNPQVAASIRQAMPRFDPQRMAGIRAAGAQVFGGAGAAEQPGLVSGERGVGGPFEGYVEAPQPFRARVPAAPSAPQPRETAEEAANKRRAILNVEREFEVNAPPKKLTPVQEAKLRSNIAKDYKSARSTIEMMDGVSRAVNDVRNLSRDQKEAITGFSGYAPSILPSSRSADTKLKNLQGKVTEMGKAAASLTGAIGQMAVQEWRIVSDMIASLDVTGMEPADLDNQLDIIEGQAKRAASITRDAYENQYVEDFARYPNRFQLPEPNAAAPRGGKSYPVLTPEQVRKAPKGTTFRTTDGRLMRKN